MQYKGKFGFNSNQTVRLRSYFSQNSPVQDFFFPETTKETLLYSWALIYLCMSRREAC